MFIDAVCSLGSDAGGRVIEDTTVSSSLLGRHRVWVGDVPGEADC